MSYFVELLNEESLSFLLSSFQDEQCSRGQMKIADFKEMMGGMLKVSPLDERLSVLCRKVIRNPFNFAAIVGLSFSQVDIDNDGHVTEHKLMSYLLQQLREREAFRSVKPLPFQDLPIFKHNVYSKVFYAFLLSKCTRNEQQQ